MNKKYLGFGVAMAALIGTAGMQQAHAVTSAPAEVGLMMTSIAAITASVPVLVQPNLDEILATTVTRTGVLTLSIDSSDGSEVSISGDESGGLLNKDLSLKVGGTTLLLSTATPSTPLYVSGSRQDGENVGVGVTIDNLNEYAVSDTAYTNTVTFTVVAAD